MTTENQRRVAAAARSGRIRGLLDYVLAVYGSESDLHIFAAVFNDAFEMEYLPPTEVSGLEGAAKMKILSLLDPAPEVTKSDQREAIIKLVHETLGEDVWHGSWRVALGRG